MTQWFQYILKWIEKYIYILDDNDDDDEDRIRMRIKQIQNTSNNWDS